MPRILIVEDHALMRDSVALMLQHAVADWVCVGVGSAGEAMEKLADGSVWDLVIVDLVLPDLSGLGLLAHIHSAQVAVPALVMSGRDDSATVTRAKNLGASGFVPKSQPVEVLCEAVATVLSGKVYEGVATPRRRRGVLMNRLNLSTAQFKVAELIIEGKSNRDIAKLLGLSEGTVKVHVTAILKTLGVTSRAQAMVLLSRDRL